MGDSAIAGKAPTGHGGALIDRLQLMKSYRNETRGLHTSFLPTGFPSHEQRGARDHEHDEHGPKDGDIGCRA